MKTCVLIRLILVTTALFSAAAAFSADENPVIVTLIRWENGGKGIVVHFEPVDIPQASERGGGTSSSPGVFYRLYRSETPILESSDLDRAELVAESDPDGLPFIDAPDGDGSYYYAVTVVRDDVEYRTIAPYQNTLIYPVHFTVPLNVAAAEQTGGKTGEAGAGGTKEEPAAAGPPEETAVEEKPEEVVSGKNLTTGSAEPVSPKSLLADIIRRDFRTGRYESALSGLQDLLERNDLTSQDRSTAHFFVGQCLYYLKRYKSSLKHFIISKDSASLDGEADLWITRCLEKLE